MPGGVYSQFEGSRAGAKVPAKQFDEGNKKRLDIKAFLAQLLKGSEANK